MVKGHQAQPPRIPALPPFGKGLYGTRLFLARLWCCQGTRDSAQRNRQATASAIAAQSPFARSRSVNFRTFPVDVFGSGPNTTVRGVL